ncbi:MAG: hypothetical protein KGZ80_13030 [Methylomonas sp.]|nr:hypothetical protein [Methylomonas sp.]PPD22523.1 MAG: hypothetical protein CTY23_01155 [Methylomonas sp.]PPD27837.1 MAG: hypothetical protein CTY22_00035 [Methylomonas sp.]PPD39946.1 MAG: hypothetical protein CTY21_00035 [Methylomonas sp.]PPD41075.1 MAG: hypothetical protein CTY17_04830 [Methylomonas sp.]
MKGFKKLALSGAIGALMLVAGSAQAHVSFHLSATGGEAPNTNGSTTTGSWTGGSPVDKGYVGNLPTTWLANIHLYNHTYNVSRANALTLPNVSTDFKLESTGNRWNPSRSWGNAMDFGLIDLDVTGNVTIKVQAESGSGFLPGFTLFQGWDASPTSNKHTAWNANPLAPSSSNPTTGASANTNPTLQPLRTLGLTYLGHASTTSSNGGIDYAYDAINQAVAITFPNLSAGKYSLWVGGNGGGSTSGNQQYFATISAVPVPTAVWLFGSAIVGMVGVGRRKQALSA